jgi:hypothetical protein
MSLILAPSDAWLVGLINKFKKIKFGIDGKKLHFPFIK